MAIVTALLLFSCTGLSAYALVFPHPQATRPSHDQPGWTPKPTEAARIHVDLGAISGNQLFGRQEANSATCGWYDGDPSKPITCSRSTDGCAYYNSKTGGFGCCEYVGPSPATTACPYVSACYDYTNPANSNSGSGVLWEPPSIACPSNAPYCVTTKLSGSSGSAWYQFGCGATATTILAYQTTTESTASTTSASSTSTTSSSMLSSVAVSTILSPTVTNTSSSSGLSSSAQTGIGVGVGVGVGCLIAGIAIGYFCLRRKKASRHHPPSYSNDKPSLGPTYGVDYRHGFAAHRNELDTSAGSHAHGKTGINELSSERAPQELEARHS